MIWIHKSTQSTFSRGCSSRPPPPMSSRPKKSSCQVGLRWFNRCFRWERTMLQMLQYSLVLQEVLLSNGKHGILFYYCIDYFVFLTYWPMEQSIGLWALNIISTEIVSIAIFRVTVTVLCYDSCVINLKTRQIKR